VTAVLAPQEVRSLLATREEIALLDLREEAVFARAHPLFAAQCPPHRLEAEASARFARREAVVFL
jgi:hypothetical protein